MNVHAPSTKVLFAQHLLAYPLAGCAVAASIFGAVVRPNLPGDPWLLDIATILCGTLGLLVGGMLGFAAPMRQRTVVSPALHLWTVAPAALSVLLIVVVTGMPAAGVAVVATSAAVGLVAAGARRRRTRSSVSARRVNQR